MKRKRHSRKFQRMAVERMRSCENVGDLATDRVTFAGDRESLDAFERGFAESGYFGSQKRWAELMAARHRKREAPAVDVAFGYTWAEEKDPSLEWLQKAVEEHDRNVPYLTCFPIFDFLRSDPRFQILLRRMNFPP